MVGGFMHGDPNDPREALAIAEHFQGEWYNGGLSQFFSNWEPEDASLVPTALRVIGFPQGAEIIGQAIARMGSQDQWQHVGHQAMMNYNSPIGQILNDLNRELGSHEATFDKAVVDFEYKLAKESGEEMFE